MAKICFKCHASKPLSAFYKHPKSTDGHLGKCKECTKSDVRANRAKNIERIRAYDRQRGLDPKRKKKVRAQYRKRTSTKTGRKREWARSKAWMEKNIIKRAAHILAYNALRNGRLTKGKCERCGTAKNIQSHHENYEKPLEVNWLCRNCHGIRHREINEERRKNGLK